MYLFDTSVWIALAFDSHPYHNIAKTEFMATNAQHPIAFCRATQQSFIRLITTAKGHGITIVTLDKDFKQFTDLSMKYLAN